MAKNAKACPQCGGKPKKKHTVLGVIILIIGIILIIIGVSTEKGGKPTKVGELDSAQKDAQNTGEAEAQTEFVVGDIVDLNNIAVTFVGVTENSGSEFNTPTDGNVYVLCEFEIENNSDKDITVSSALCFEAYCDDYTVNMSLMAMVEKGDKNQLDGIVAAGKKFNVVIGYELPENWQELEIRFTPDFWRGKDIIFVAQH